MRLDHLADAVVRAVIPFQGGLRRLKRRLRPYEEDDANSDYCITNGLEQLAALRRLSIAVDGAGQVTVDGRILGRLRVERTPEDVVLERQGSGLFVPPATRLPDRNAAGVRQGALEASNVNILDGLVELVLIQRAYGALHQVDAIAESVEGLATELGKPAT